MHFKWGSETPTQNSEAGNMALKYLSQQNSATKIKIIIESLLKF